MPSLWMTALGAFLSFCALAQAEETTLQAADGLSVTADVYRVDDAADRPWIVLAHMAGASRGEYRSIAPRLVALGFNAVALDQRSGRAFGGVANQTAARAAAQSLPRDYVDAIPDIEAGLAFAHAQTSGPVLLWGSSYSAALALILAGEADADLDGVIAFSPGEYISGRSVTQAAARIAAPALIVSPPEEQAQWASIFEAIPHDRKAGFSAEAGGRHGSSSLIPEFTPNADAYWREVEAFLERYAPAR